LGWQAIDTDERVQFEDNLPLEDSAGAWIQQAGYARANVYWDALRVQLNVAPRAGTVAFDDVMLVEIHEPPSSLLDRPT